MMNKIDYLELVLSLKKTHMELLKNDNLVVIDIRNAPKEVKKTKIKGSLEIPAKEIASRLGEIDKSKVVVVYDWNGGTDLGKVSQLILLKNGFDAYELSGGIEAWVGMSLPLDAL